MIGNAHAYTLLDTYLQTYCTESLIADEAAASSDANQAGAGAYAQNSNIWTEKDVLNVHFLNPEILDQENWKCEYGVLNTTNILSWAAAWNTKKCPNIPIFKKTGRPESADIRVKFEEGTNYFKILNPSSVWPHR